MGNKSANRNRQTDGERRRGGRRLRIQRGSRDARMAALSSSARILTDMAARRGVCVLTKPDGALGELRPAPTAKLTASVWRDGQYTVSSDTQWTLKAGTERAIAVGAPGHGGVEAVYIFAKPDSGVWASTSVATMIEPHDVVEQRDDFGRFGIHQRGRRHDSGWFITR